MSLNKIRYHTDEIQFLKYNVLKLYTNTSRCFDLLSVQQGYQMLSVFGDADVLSKINPEI